MGDLERIADAVLRLSNALQRAGLEAPVAITVTPRTEGAIRAMRDASGLASFDAREMRDSTTYSRSICGVPFHAER